MKAQKALVLGATGLVGSNLVKLLLADDAYETVRVLVRNEYDVKHPKLNAARVDFDNVEDFRSKKGKGDSIFCCIGTTMKKVKGDKAAYKKIDYDIPVNAAKFGLAAGYTKYILVSSVGANASSKNFYLQLKGEVENAIGELPYRSFHVLQPSILLGNRNELRLGEMLGKGVMQGLSIFFWGSLKKYKGVDAFSVAKAMVASSKSVAAGKHIYTYQEMCELCKS